MRALLQRVRSASVTVAGETIASIDQGLLVFAALLTTDTEQRIARMAERVLQYRMFADEQQRMNCNVQQINGAVLVVSQFTLAANTDKGNRPSFGPAMAPDLASTQYEYFLSQIKERYSNVVSGQFQADMQVSLVNDGPVTFWLDT